MTKVLCVDDSATMRKMVTHTLKATGLYECVEAADGVEGLAMVQQENPDLIITDLNMPNMNGLDLTAAIRDLVSHRYTPILLLTTETSEALRQVAKERGATGWMVKPFNPEKLLRTLEKVLLVH